MGNGKQEHCREEFYQIRWQRLDHFLGQLLKKICGNDLNNREEREIFDAVQGVMRLPKNMRRVRRFLDFLDPVNDHGPSARLSKWCGTGSLSWVFDNETDDLTFDSHTMFGFDVTDFLDNAEVRTLIVMNLLKILYKTS